MRCETCPNKQYVHSQVALYYFKQSGLKAHIGPKQYFSFFVTCIITSDMRNPNLFGQGKPRGNGDSASICLWLRLGNNATTMFGWVWPTAGESPAIITYNNYWRAHNGKILWSYAEIWTSPLLVSPFLLFNFMCDDNINHFLSSRSLQNKQIENISIFLHVCSHSIRS